jgi:hypothetical protein
MSDSYLANILSQFAARGVELNPPIEQSSLLILIEICPFPLPSSYIEFLQYCDGFRNYTVDMKSDLAVWSSELVIAKARLEHKSYLCIGDFLLQSELICMDPRGIFYEDRGLIIAADMIVFCEALVDGQYDS